MHPKFPMNGILGYILLTTKLKILMNLKNIHGKNRINQIELARKNLIIQIKVIMKLIKNIKVGKASSLKIFIVLIFITFTSSQNLLGSSELTKENFIEIKILDKVSSKNTLLKIKIGEEQIFKNLSIKPLKCKNSEFDDNPEITAYLQVKDLTYKSNDEVFVFNGWTFSSSPTIKPFDHPVYDIWLTRCY